MRLPKSILSNLEVSTRETLSRRSRTGRARGRKFEKSTAEDIRAALGAHPEDVKRTPASVGGKDIILHHALRERFPYGVECKDTKTLSVPAWLQQAEDNAEKDESIPIVVFKLPRNAKKYVIVPFDHFLELAVPKESANDGRQRGATAPANSPGKR